MRKPCLLAFFPLEIARLVEEYEKWRFQGNLLHQYTFAAPWRMRKRRKNKSPVVALAPVLANGLVFWLEADCEIRSWPRVPLPGWDASAAHAYLGPAGFVETAHLVVSEDLLWVCVAVNQFLIFQNLQGPLRNGSTSRHVFYRASPILRLFCLSGSSSSSSSVLLCQTGQDLVSFEPDLYDLAVRSRLRSSAETTVEDIGEGVIKLSDPSKPCLYWDVVQNLAVSPKPQEKNKEGEFVLKVSKRTNHVRVFERAFGPRAAFETWTDNLIGVSWSKARRLAIATSYGVTIYD